VGPWVKGCLGEGFLLAMDFLRADKVGSGEGSAGATPLLTVGISGGPCFSRVIFGVFRDDSSGEETISSISGGDCLGTHPVCDVFAYFEWLYERIFLWIWLRVLAWWI